MDPSDNPLAKPENVDLSVSDLPSKLLIVVQMLSHFKSPS